MTGLVEGKMPIIEKWKLIEPFWENSRYTGYGRVLSIIARDLYGLDKIDSTTIEELE